MRLVRGTGGRGLAAIYPAQEDKHLVRPLLAVTRREVQAYLTALGQAWREDSSNRDLHHTRNRVRHELLPILERDFNPAIRHTLAGLAEIARAEAEYWDAETAALLTRLVRQGKPSRSGRTASRDASHMLTIDLAPFQTLPLALRRQVLYRVGEQLGITLDFTHIQNLIELAEGKLRGRRTLLPGGIVAVVSFRELQFCPLQEDAPGADYQYSLPVPGEVMVPELGSMIRVRLVRVGEGAAAGYNTGALLVRSLLAPELTVRNWRAGDRFFPARTKSPKKLKDLLQAGRLGQPLSSAQRRAWPVVESAGEIVWVRGFASPERLAANAGENQDAVSIEETEVNSWKKE
jgi:tRNA(Ile)-lysidine synthase